MKEKSARALLWGVWFIGLAAGQLHYAILRGWPLLTVPAAALMAVGLVTAVAASISLFSEVYRMQNRALLAALQEEDS